MVRKLLLSLIPMFFSFNLCIVNAQSITNVELFDIEKNEIIKTTKPNRKIQLEVEKIIKEIDDIVRKLKPIPDKGYMIRIPLKPSIQLENQWVYALIDEVIIIIPEDEEPYLLLFDDENKTHFFTFEAKIDTLLNTLSFSL
ncbi:hypothetical protein H8S33_00110 [Ornithinibacillus sp. BX22]|uniref:Group-specific protein n=1 Tax=Ornithinibacillus hominis TaxID=2763055 RepID=A0A923L2J8_9BACI|nr:hypothetical protein [Ornithinibacillus hominis]